MGAHHDPLRQCNYLHQSLVQDKLALGVFLGAGCPVSVRVERNGTVEPLIPDIAGLTAEVAGGLRDSEAAGLLQTVQAQFVEDEVLDPNIEQILSHVRALRQVVGAGAVRGLDAAELEILEREICQAIVGITSRSLPAAHTPYHDLASWAGAIRRDTAVEIFTTNYDLLMEEALEHYRTPYFDGFVGARCPYFDTHAIEEDVLPARWVRLWKLHGSVNWCQGADGRVWRCGVGDGPRDRHHVIHPSHLKYTESRRMPYLAMIDRLRAFLRRPSAFLVVCGYSFGDEHINEVILQGLAGNASATVFALLFGPLESYARRVKLDSVLPNLSVLAEDESVVGGIRGAWQSKDCPDETVVAAAIDWVPDPDTAGQKRAMFRLGDFVRFGSFVSALAGQRGYASTAGGNAQAAVKTAHG